MYCVDDIWMKYVKINKKVIVTGLEPATSRPVILRSTIDLHDPSNHSLPHAHNYNTTLSIKYYDSYYNHEISYHSHSGSLSPLPGSTSASPCLHSSSSPPWQLLRNHQSPRLPRQIRRTFILSLRFHLRLPHRDHQLRRKGKCFQK